MFSVFCSHFPQFLFHSGALDLEKKKVCNFELHVRGCVLRLASAHLQVCGICIHVCVFACRALQASTRTQHLPPTPQPPNQHKHTCTHSTTQLYCPVSRLLQRECVMVTSILSDPCVPSHSPSDPYMCSYMLCLCLLVDLCRKPILPPAPFPPTQHIPIHTHKHTDMLACMWTH